MSTFKKIVAAPFRAVGWVGGQIKNGYDAAVSRAKPVASQVASAATATVNRVKAGAVKAAKVVADDLRRTGRVLVGGASLVVRGVGSVLGFVVKACYRTLTTTLFALRMLLLGAATAVVAGTALVGVSVIAIGVVMLAAALWVGRGLVAGAQAIGAWFQRNALVIGDVLYQISVMATVIAAVWALAATVVIGVPTLGIPAAEGVVLASAALWAAMVGAVTGLAGMMIDATSDRKVQVVYTAPCRRVLPGDVYPGVVGFAANA